MDRMKRIMKEVNALREEQDQLWSQEGIKIGEMDEDNLEVLYPIIRGPIDTPYEGGSFCLRFQFPNEYPYKPPRVLFLTKVWHPNIDRRSGEVCLDVLGLKWRSSMNIRVALLSLIALLSSPEGDGPLDEIVGRQFNNELEMFADTARFWTYMNAGGLKCVPEFFRKMEAIKEMELGSSQFEIIDALSTVNWSVEDAASILIDGTNGQEDFRVDRLNRMLPLQDVLHDFY